MQKKKRIGVITLPFTPNYGWLLQAYALQRVLEKLGYEPFLIYRKWDKTKQNSGIVSAIKRWIYYHLLCKKLYYFFKYNLVKTKLYRDSQSLQNVIREYKLDALVVGSDQVWRFENTRGAGYNFFLDFSKNYNVIRIAYAASFGVDCWTGTDDELTKAKELLQQFNAVSVREETGVRLCSDVMKVKALLVLDPTLLLSASDYDRLIDKNIYSNNDAVLSTYILDPSSEKEKYINSVAEIKKMRVNPLYVDNRKRCVQTYSSLSDWLSGIRNSQFVIVDSFHGMVFSIIFRKNFLVIANKHRGLTRFESLLSMLGLNNRLVYNLNEVRRDIIEQNIDYDRVEQTLDEKRELSVIFLQDNIK